MNRLLLWIALGICLPACTNWPKEGYFADIPVYSDERILFQQHYDYLNLHLSIANLRGAETCIPAHVKSVDNINSRVAKSIAVEDLQDIKSEMAILESKITNLIVQLNRVTTKTNCALPPRLLTTNFVHPLTYQLDLLLYCAPQFEVGNATMTPLYKVCLRQASFILLDNPDIVIEYTKYKKLADSSEPTIDRPKHHYNQDIVVHDVDAIEEVPDMSLVTSRDQSNEEYNEVMRQYLIFDQVPSVTTQQLSQVQLNIEQVHTPIQIQEVDSVTPTAMQQNVNTKVNLSTENMALLNLRTDVIFSYVTDLTANQSQNKVIYEQLNLGVSLPSMPVISTIMWQSTSNKAVDHKVKDWRFLLTEGELFSDKILPKGVAL